MTTRDELVVALAGRYPLGSRADRGRMLDEFAALTGHHRKHAMRLLRAGVSNGRSSPRPERRMYNQATREALIVIWEASDRICGKRLQPLVPILVSAMERHGHLQLAPEVLAGLLLLGTTSFGGHPDGPNKGTGSGKGTVFALAPDGTETVGYRFNGVPDGKRPFSGLIDVGGTLYGTTEYGGTAGYGTVFALAPDGTETVLHSFAGGSDGRAPIGNLINVNGVLYGTTQFGGSGCSKGCGTVFSITPAGVETVLFQFQADTGAYATGGLLQVGSELYGMAFSGAAEGVGSVYSITLEGQLTGVHPFRRDNGAFPYGSLIDVGGMLYGTTSSGGTGTACVFLCGTIFSMTPHGAIKVVHDFQGGSGDGSEPEAGLINVGGVLYGTTVFGGGAGCQFGEGCGTVFAFTP